MYHLKLTEVFPVSSNIIHNESYLRGWDGEVENDDDEEVVQQIPSVVQPSAVVPNDTSTNITQTHGPVASDAIDDDLLAGPGGSLDNECVPFNYESAVVEEGPVEDAVVASELIAHEPHSAVEVSNQPGPRRSGRSRQKPQWLNDFVEDG